LNTVVYYPHIFPSPDWLKLAPICWNKVYTLVPANWSYDPVDDPEEVLKLDQELGGILLPLNTQLMASTIEHGIQELEELNTRFMRWVEANPEQLYQEKMRQPYNPQPRKVPLYVGKVTGEVYHFLMQ
jgi:hypothetical protein